MRRLPHVRRVVLTCLAASANHGYGVIVWAKSLDPDEPRLSVGSVYGALETLEAEDLIEFDSDTVENGRARRVMRITHQGRSVLLAELDRLEREVGAARTALGARNAPATPRLTFGTTRL